MHQDALKTLKEIQDSLKELESHDFTDADLNILDQMKFQVDRTIGWIKMSPAMMAMPKTIDMQDLERRTYQLVGQRKPASVRGVSIE